MASDRVSQQNGGEVVEEIIATSHTSHCPGQHVPLKSDGDNDESSAADIHFTGLTWPHAAVIVAKVQFGIGCLGIPKTFSTLGYVPGLISLLLLSVICTYTGVLCGHIRLIHPEILSPAELGAVLCGGNRYVREFFAVLYGILLVMICSSAMLTTSIALNAVSSHAICTLGFTGIIAAAGVIIGGGIRQMTKIAWLGWVGVISVALGIWVLVIAMLTRSFPLESLGQTGNVRVQAFNSSPSFVDAIMAVVSQLFALLGSITFYGVAAEMSRPRDFTKAVLAGQGFVVLNYIVIGCLVYGKAGQFIASPALGSAGQPFKKICYGLSLPGVLISTVLFIHIASKYAFMRILQNSRHLNKSTVTHWTVWASCYVGIALVAFVLAGAIPIFDDLLSLIGSTTGAFFTLIFGGLTSLYILVHTHKGRTTAALEASQERSVDEKKGPNSDFTEEVDDVKAPSSEQTSSPQQSAVRLASPASWWTGLRHSWFGQCHRIAFVDPATRSWRTQAHFLAGWSLIVVGLFIMGGATYATVVSIINNYKSGKISGAFSCDDNSNSS
ncbi:unnamed protein product [Parajaminaea phylloscopi]